MLRVFSAFLFACTSICASCTDASSSRIQGYIEGEFLYIASPLSGELESLAVARGAQVKKGDTLFQLESAAEQAARDEADRRLAQARADLEDTRKGKRPSELESLEAHLEQSRAALELAKLELSRQETLARSGATPSADLDRARSLHDQRTAEVAQLEADLTSARLGSRVEGRSIVKARTEGLKELLDVRDLLRAKPDVFDKDDPMPAALEISQRVDEARAHAFRP